MTTSTSSPLAVSSAAQRAAGWAGILFLPFFVLGCLLALDSPDLDDSDAQWRAWFADSGNRTEKIIGVYLLIVAALLFLAFAFGLVERLRAYHPASALLRAAGAAAAVFAALVIAGGIEAGGVAGNISFGDTPVPSDADIMRQNIGYPFIFVAGALVAAAFIAVTAAHARRARVFSTPLVVVSYIFAVLLIGASFFLPMAALPIWTLIVGIVLLRGASRSGAAAAAPPVVT